MSKTPPYRRTTRDKGEAVEFLILAVFWIVVWGGIGYWIAGQKQRSEVEGAALGCLLGPIGWIIEALLPTGVPPAQPSPRVIATARRPYFEEQRTAPNIPNALQVPFASSPDAKRAAKGLHGAPGNWMSFMGVTPEDAVTQLAAFEAKQYPTSGKRVVEAAWVANDEAPTIKAAFGDPDKEYDLLFPNLPRVVWQSKVDAERDQQASPGGAPISPAPTATRATVAPEAVQERELPALEPHQSVASPGPTDAAARPTKQCPDCAETILADARICRFCRYEFWPRAE